jgi:PmbA protein
VTYRSGKADAIEEAARMSLSVSLYSDGRYTTFTTSDLKGEAIDASMGRATALCMAMRKDRDRTITDPMLYRNREVRDLKIFDKDIIDAVSPESRHDSARTMEQSALTHAGKIVVSAEATCRESRETVYQLHTNGFEGNAASTEFWSMARVSIQDKGGKRPSGYYGAGARFRNDLMSPSEVGRRAAEYALLGLGSTQIATTRLPMIVENRAAERLIYLLLKAMTGRVLYQGASFLKGKAEKRIGSDLLDLNDDPFIEKGFASRLFDSEGISAKKTALIERGVLRNYYIDTYYGKKLSMPPTTGRGSNVVIAPGKKDLSGLIADIDRGVLVRGFIGGNSNDVTGDLSMGIHGSLIEKGTISHAVSEMNIAGNHSDLWQRLVAAGNDVHPYGSVRTPSLVFDGVQFSGKKA